MARIITCNRIKPIRTTGPDIRVKREMLEDYRANVAREAHLRNTICKACGYSLMNCKCNID